MYKEDSTTIQCITCSWYLTAPSVDTSVIGVMKMGNIIPEAEIKPSSLAFQARVLAITPPKLGDITTLPVY